MWLGSVGAGLARASCPVVTEDGLDLAQALPYTGVSAPSSRARAPGAGQGLLAGQVQKLHVGRGSLSRGSPEHLGQTPALPRICYKAWG